MDILSLLIGFSIGGLIGGIVCYIWANGRYQALLLADEKTKGALEAQKQQIAQVEGELVRIRLANQEAQNTIRSQERGYTRIETEHALLKKQLERREQEWTQMQGAFQKEFENLAYKILSQQSQSLSTTNESSLNALLQPLKERIQAFEKRVEESYGQEARERFHLQKQLTELVKMSELMGNEARNLTRALKSENKTQGNWGELILSKVLESSGLREGEEFQTQAKGMELRSDSGKRLQPDVVIQLPEQKHLIIDSKVSLTAYERFVNAESETARNLALSQHIASVKGHIQNLSDKHYHSLSGVQSPDFVLLFMPLESALSVSLQGDATLFQFAWQRRIVLVSPTTLLATLKTVASIWKLEKQNKNAEEIAKRGGLLYDKFVNFVKDLKAIERNLDKTRESYSQAMNKLQLGQGNLIKQAQQLEELGIRNKKKLDT